MQEYDKALKFWDDFFAGAEAEDELVGTLECAPADDALRSLVACRNVLDFGCGDGWASFIMSQMGAGKVLGVDASEHAVQIARDKAQRHGIQGVAFEQGDEKYLRTLPEESFDGVFTCNTLDVVPDTVCAEILSAIEALCARDARIVVFLNPYIDEELKNKLSMQEILPGHFTKNGILRALNHTDAQWVDIFSEHFTDVETSTFHLKQEPDFYIRRMFTMRRA